jgi:hypothetical protein
VNTALITGAARGIGLATAQAFIAAGWRVLAVSNKSIIDLPLVNRNILMLMVLEPGVAPSTPNNNLRVALASGQPLVFETASNNSYTFGGDQHPDVVGNPVLSSGKSITHGSTPLRLRSPRTSAQENSPVPIPECGLTGREIWISLYSKNG